MEITTLLLIYVLMSAAYVLAHFSGGGLSLLSFPLLTFLGIPPQLAITSVKFGTFGSITGIIRYAKAGKIDWKRIPLFVFLSIIAGVIGANVLLAINEEALRTVFGVLILVMLPFLLFKPKWGLTNTNVHKKKEHKLFGYVLYFLLSIILATIGGMGLFLTFIFVSFFGYTLVEANATRRVPLYILNGTAAIVFMLHGAVDYRVGFTLILASMTGNYIGAHVSVVKGNKFVKYFFSGIIFVSAIKLLFF